MPSFDVVSKVQMHEVDNAVQQTAKEIATRYDFRDTGSSIERTEEGIVLRANSEGRIDAAFTVLQEKLVRRKVSLKSIDAQNTEQSGATFRKLLKITQGLSTEKAKEVVKYLKRSRATRCASTAARRTSCSRRSRPCARRTSAWNYSSRTTGTEAVAFSSPLAAPCTGARSAARCVPTTDPGASRACAGG